jgi:hypothetical protein
MDDGHHGWLIAGHARRCGTQSSHRPAPGICGLEQNLHRPFAAGTKPKHQIIIAAGIVGQTPRTAALQHPQGVLTQVVFEATAAEQAGEPAI